MLDVVFSGANAAAFGTEEWVRIVCPGFMGSLVCKFYFLTHISTSKQLHERTSYTARMGIVCFEVMLKLLFNICFNAGGDGASIARSNVGVANTCIGCVLSS